MRRHHRALLVVSVIQQVWQYIVYHLLNLGVVVFCIALYANASSRGTMSARHVVVLIVLTLRCVSAIGQLLRGLIRGVRASIPCDHTCVLARLPKLDARQIGELQDPCAICRCRAQGQDEMVRLECGHCFHVDCISDWLKIQVGALSYICRVFVHSFEKNRCAAAYVGTSCCRTEYRATLYGGRSSRKCSFNSTNRGRFHLFDCLISVIISSSELRKNRCRKWLFIEHAIQLLCKAKRSLFSFPTLEHCTRFLSCRQSDPCARLEKNSK